MGAARAPGHHRRLVRIAPAQAGAGAGWPAAAEETIDGIDYRWLATPSYRGNGAARVRNMLAFVLRLQRERRGWRPNCGRMRDRFQHLPARHLAGHRIARLAGARLLFEVHDLWPLSPMELGGHSRWHPFIMLLQAAEDRACRRADAIVSILPKVRAHLEAHGMAPHKLHLVPNGVDPAEWECADALLPALARARPSAPCAARAASSSAMPARTASRMPSAPCSMPRSGYATSRWPSCWWAPVRTSRRWQRQAAELGLANVHFFDPVSKRQVPALLQRFDVAYIGWRRQPCTASASRPTS
jgi:hypothetical protein